MKKKYILISLIIVIVLGASGALAWYLKNHNSNTTPATKPTANNKTAEQVAPAATPEEAPIPSTPAQSQKTTPTAPSPTPAPTPTPATSTRPTISPLNKEISRGLTNQKQIALTFDAGSGSTQTPQILDILKQNNLHATFSLTGKWIEQNPDLVLRMIADGHTFINHTYSHPHLTQISDDQIKEELAKTEALLKNLNSQAVMKPYFRPPYGDRNQHVWDYAASLGYQSIYWTVDALDWKAGVTASEVKQRIFDAAKPGAIILMHVGDDITPAVLQEVISHLQSLGYELVPLEEILR